MRKELLLWALLGMLWVAGVVWSGCVECPSTPCGRNFRRGPGCVCLVTCFPGERDACVEGFLCGEDGKSCVDDPNGPDLEASDAQEAPEGGSGESVTPTERATNEQPPD